MRGFSTFFLPTERKTASEHLLVHPSNSGEIALIGKEACDSAFQMLGIQNRSILHRTFFSGPDRVSGQPEDTFWDKAEQGGFRVLKRWPSSGPARREPLRLRPCSGPSTPGQGRVPGLPC